MFSRSAQLTWFRALSVCLVLAVVVLGKHIALNPQRVEAQSPDPQAIGASPSSSPAMSPDVSPSASDSAAAEPSPTTDPSIQQKSPMADKIASLRTQYRGEVEAYRKAEQEYVVAKGQWETVKTLVALETAVKKTKAVLAARTRVLQVYLELVQTILLDTQGVNLAQKTVVSDELTLRLGELKTHAAAIEASTDRDAMNARSDEFSLLSPLVVSAAHKGMALIAVGRLQNVADLARLIHTDILEVQSTATVSAVQQAERDRANKEIVRSQEEVTAQMQELNQTLQNAESKTVTESIYVRTQQQLGPVYASLSQVLSFLKESLRY